MRTPRPERTEFGVLGCRCRTSGLSVGLERWIRTRWETASADRTPSSYRIDIARRATAPRRSSHRLEPSQTTALGGATLIWARHADRWWSSGGGTADRGVSLRLFARRARVTVWWRDAPPLHALHVALCESLRNGGYVPLHAAAIARDGCAVALLGPSGAGKSSTLVEAIGSGWHPLAEDFAWLELHSRRLHAWPGDRGVRLDPQGIARLDESWRARQWRRDIDGKLVLDFDTIGPERQQTAELARAVVLHRDASRDSLHEPLAARDALRGLWESAGVPLCAVNCAAFAAACPSLIARVAWSRMVLGRHRVRL